MEGLTELVKFVREGGTLITEGSTSTIFPEYSVTNGVTVESPEGLFVRGSVMRGVFSDRRSPIAYGYDAQVPVYFSQGPVLNVGGGGGFGGRGGGDDRPGVGMNITPMAAADQSPRRRSIPMRATPRRRPLRHGRRPRRSRRRCRCGSWRRGPRRPGWRRVRRRGGGRWAARRARVPVATLTTCCCRACWSAVRRSPTAPRSSTSRSARATS